MHMPIVGSTGTIRHPAGGCAAVAESAIFIRRHSRSSTARSVGMPSESLYDCLSEEAENVPADRWVLVINALSLVDA